MAFSVPRVVPAFDDPNRFNEDQRWVSSGMGSSSGHQKGFTSSWLGGDQQLPMYKDKPYTQSRKRKRWCSKRLWGTIIAAFMLFLYFFGLLPGVPPEKQSRIEIGSKWKWWGRDAADWPERQQRVKQAFLQSWTAYERYGWGMDEYHPASRTGRMFNKKGVGWIIIDSLDTLMIMGLSDEVKRAREWIKTSLDWDQDGEVNTFETTIRMLGGLLSAHYLSNEMPELIAQEDTGVRESEHDEDLYLEKAVDLADRLLQAFETGSGIPTSGVDLKSGKGIESPADGGAASTSEAATVQLELKYVAKLTGEQHYWERAERVTKAVDHNNMTDGLLPIYIYPQTGVFRGNEIRLGSRGDSYYEYLIKQFLQTSQKELIYQDMWEQALEGVKKHLIAHTTPNQLTFIGERPNGLNSELRAKMDHLVCFMPGAVALGATLGLTVAEARITSFWSKKHEEDIQLARELMQTCYAMYAVTATGLGPEIAWFHTKDEGSDPTQINPPLLKHGDSVPLSWKKDFDIRSNDVHNLQRPEVVESLFLMHRITGDEMYRDWGWKIFEAFMQHSRVPGPGGAAVSPRHGEKQQQHLAVGANGELVHGGFTTLADVTSVPAKQRDHMESFWLAETLKYLYLLFGEKDVLPLEKIVFNTEAHPLPKFDMGEHFKTGWQREGGLKMQKVEHVMKKGSRRRTHEEPTMRQ